MASKFFLVHEHTIAVLNINEKGRKKGYLTYLRLRKTSKRN